MPSDVTHAWRQCRTVKKQVIQPNPKTISHGKKCVRKKRAHQRIFFATDDNFSLDYNIFVGRSVVNSTNNLGKKVVVFCFYGANAQVGLDPYLPIQAFNPCYVESGNHSHGFRMRLPAACFTLVASRFC